MRNNDERWVSIFTDNDTIIKEISLFDHKKHFEDPIKNKRFTRIIFAKNKSKGEFVFKGEYKLNVKESKKERVFLIWERVATTVKTYPPKT